MQIDGQTEKVKVNESSPGVAEMTLGKVNTVPDIGSNEHDFREEEDKEEDKERDKEEEDIAAIMGLRQRLGTLNRVSYEMHEAGGVSKEHRIALESFDEDGVLPNRNGYTAAPSRTNYEETREFVEQARYKVAGNTYKTMCTNMADNMHHVASTISELPTFADMKTMLTEHEESVRAVAMLKLPDEVPASALDTSVLDDGLRAYTRGAHPDDDGEELLECKSAFNAPMIVMGNSIRLQRFVQQAHAIRMSDLTTSIGGTLNDDREEKASLLLELLARANELAEFDVRAVPNQNPLAISKLLRSVIHPPETPYTSAELNNWIICDATINLLYNPNNDSGEAGLPFDIMHVIDKFATTMYDAEEWPENPESLVTKVEALRESVYVLEQGMDVYIMLIEKLTMLIKRSTFFYDEMYKILDTAIQSATTTPSVVVNVE